MDRDKSIIAQNAGTTAATLYNALAQGEWEPGLYDEIRLHVFNGTLELAGAETVVEVFEGESGTTGIQTTASVVNHPSATGGKPFADVELNFGKHRGKTIAEVDAEDRGWLEWAAENSNNGFIKTRIQKYLAA